MADEIKTETPGELINSMRGAVREDFEKQYHERFAAGWQQARREQDEADSRRICAVREEQAQRLAEYRRGHWYDLGLVMASAVTGFAAGWHAQKNVDLRVGGVPVCAVGGLPGVVLGFKFDESMATRASLAVGGAMFSLGTVVFARCHPEPPSESGSEEKIV
jgi:hypothetical protein